MRLPYRKGRYYLSGADWLIGVLDDYMRVSSGVGNHSSLVIELGGSLSANLLAARLNLLAQHFPELQGWVSRDWLNLCPYWQFSKKPCAFPLEIFELGEDSNEKELLLSGFLNSPIGSGKGNEHLSFRILRYSGRDCLLLSFDHRLLDARGAELFLEFLADIPDDEVLERVAGVKRTDGAELRNWRERFSAGRDVQRRLMALSRDSCHGFVAPVTNRRGTVGRLSYRTDHFPCAAASRISLTGEKTAGYMMEMPYLLSLTVSSLYAGMPDKDCRLLVAVPVDLRATGREREKLLFNHVGFLFFSLRLSPGIGSGEILDQIRAQYIEQVQMDFPRRFFEALYPGRIFPLSFLRQLLKLPVKGRMATLFFASLGDLSTSSREILGVPVERIWHLPRVPSPPGLAVLFNRSCGELHLTTVRDESIGERNLADFPGLLVRELEDIGNVSSDA